MKRLLVLAAIIFILSTSQGYSMEKPFSVHMYPFVGYWMGGDWLKGEEYLGQSYLYGARLGFALGEHFILEGGCEFSPNEFVGSELAKEGDADLSLYYANFLAHIYSSRKWCPYVMAGVGRMYIDTDVKVKDSGPETFMLGVGLTYYYMENIGLRTEARQVIIEQSPDNILVTVGLELRLLGRWHREEKAAPPPPPLDSDGDGVLDDLDQCPVTPIGTRVDSSGCPIDSDGDTVPDGPDKCPDTPSGAKVDHRGCPGDSDNDGVLDGIDQCPDTLAGAKVDAKGCPLDGDNDGVFDGLDLCPKTPAGMKVDERGCPTDSDGDTVPDAHDQCPDTPTGTPVDTTGCPEAAEREADSDGDTVPDSIDQCPNTIPGAEVDETGCQIIEDRLVLEGITFRTGSSRIQPESFIVLNSVIEVLKAHTELKIEIQGYTDSTGRLSTNMRLSERRARSVYNYLIKAGISRDRLSYKGYGPENPIATNDTPEGRAKNRRIEFKIVE